MLSEAVLVEWMDILLSAGVKVREFFEKNFYECLSPWSPRFPCILFPLAILIPPLCVCSTSFDLTHVCIYLWSLADCGLSAELNLFPSFGFTLLALY